MEPQPTLQVVSDVVCPWCYIGKRRLGKALALLGRKNLGRLGLRLHWSAFQLNPHAPPEGWSRHAYRAAKFGSEEVSARLEARVVATGDEEGIGFRFDRVEKTPNTFDAHRLIWLAGREGVQDAVVENLFRAYFVEGQNVGDRSVLRDIGVSSGLNSAQIVALLAGDLGAQDVAHDEEQARSHGVSGVPTFIFNGEALTSGAHPPQLLASMLATAIGDGVCSGDGPCGLNDGPCT